MSNEIVKYNGMTLNEILNLPEDKMLDIAYDILRATNHEIRATSKRVRASLARINAMEKTADLYRPVRPNYQEWPEI